MVPARLRGLRQEVDVYEGARADLARACRLPRSAAARATCSVRGGQAAPAGADGGRACHRASEEPRRARGALLRTTQDAGTVALERRRCESVSDFGRANG